jgi:DNA-binding NarL/FixJ family response regulator
MGDVHGYLLKAEGMDAYARAVQAVSRGRKYYSERAIELAFNSPEVPKLSPRELDVLKLAAHGLKTAEIAERLFISSRTVETHVDNAMDKLVVRNRTAAVAKAIELGLISTGMREEGP